ncbi:hypothetical protein TNCV_2382721, partial [Trichonephila clavipes]
MQRLLVELSFFNKTMLDPHTESAVVTRLLSALDLAVSPDLSPIEHIWDHFGWRAGYSMSLKELVAVMVQQDIELKCLKTSYKIFVCPNARSHSRRAFLQEGGFNR